MTAQLMSVIVGMGELHVTRDESVVLTCAGLGSCVAVCAYDAAAHVAGMCHVVLPSSGGRDGEPSARYADQAVALLLDRMVREGAALRRIEMKVAGGARVIRKTQDAPLFNVGERNVAAVLAALDKAGRRPAAADTGGHHGRTVRLFVHSGAVRVNGVDGTEMTL